MVTIQSQVLNLVNFVYLEAFSKLFLNEFTNIRHGILGSAHSHIFLLKLDLQNISAKRYIYSIIASQLTMQTFDSY